jgi:integrase
VRILRDPQSGKKEARQTVTEAQAILDGCGHLRDRLLLAMLLEAGLRIREALGMRHEDIDIGGCLVRVVPRDNANGMRAKGAGPGGPGRSAADAAVCRLPEPRVPGCRFGLRVISTSR